MAPTANYFSTAEVTKLFWARTEGEFFAILRGGAPSIHLSSYPFSIHESTHKLFVKVLQKAVDFLSLSVAIWLELTCSHGMSVVWI